MMRTLTFLFAFIPLVLVGQQAQLSFYTGSPFTRNYAPKEYKGHSQTWSIVQDKNGLMYFANHMGILVYDGVAWRKVKVPGDNFIAALTIDKKTNRVYAGLVGDFGYLEADKKGKLKYVSLLPKVKEADKSFDHVWRVRVAHDGSIYFGANDALFRYKNGEMKAWHFKEKLKYVHCVAGQVFLQKVGAGLFRLEGDNFKPIDGGAQFKTSIRFMLPYTKKGGRVTQLLLGENATALWLYNLEKKQFKRFRTEADKFIIDNRFYCGVLLPGKRIAIGTLNGGLVIVNRQGKAVEYINEKSGLQNQRILSCYYSSQSKVLWVALNNGISSIETETPLRFWDKKKGISSSVNAINAYRKTKNGQENIYVSTVSGLRAYSNGSFKVDSIIGKKEIWDLLNMRLSGDAPPVLLAAAFEGIYEVSPKGTRQIAKLREHVFCLYRSRHEKNKVYFGSRAGLAYLTYKDGDWTVGEYIEGTKGEVRDINEDAQGNIWICIKSKGIARLQANGEVLFYGNKAGVPKTTFIWIAKCDNQLFFLSDRDTYKFDKAQQRFIKTKQLSQYFGTTVLYPPTDAKDGKDSLLTVRNRKGFFEIAVRQGNGAYWRDTITMKRLKEHESDWGHIQDKSVVWLGTTTGLVAHNLEFPPTRLHLMPSPLIRKVSVTKDSLLFGGHTTALPKHYQLPYELNSLAFEYSCPYFIKNELTEYQYKLEGYDKSWASWRKETKKEYTNLPEGTYTFKVRAKNMYDIESSVATYRFDVLPPWYRTWWAYVLYAVGVVLLFLLLVKLYTLRLIAQKKALENKVEVRTSEIRQQKEVISTKNDELQQKSEEIMAQHDAIAVKNKLLDTQNHQITQSIKAARSIQQAILPFNKRMQGLLDDYFVLYRPKDIVSGDFYWLSKIDEKVFLAVVDCTGHGVPGAFMSMMGCTLMNKIVNEQRMTDPAKILENLRADVRHALKQEQGDNKHGMDMALISLEPLGEAQVKVQFAGAKRPLWYTNEAMSEMKAVKGSRISIGISYTNHRQFETRELMLDKGTTIYLSTDGLADQNDEKRRKLSSEYLMQLLLDNSRLPLHSQKEALEQQLAQHMQNTEQRDDILLIGIKV